MNYCIDCEYSNDPEFGSPGRSELTEANSGMVCMEETLLDPVSKKSRLCKDIRIIANNVMDCTKYKDK